ncbi:MAG: hypothetical protein L0211_14040, partial [Planctomycetaceae bacterium]|nr:hypothetical protein [Planctomycetaceae bacterium]
MSFDPYYKWLGIPPEEQPPNHYRLLGLTLYEQNSDAIDNAGDRQMAHVRTFQAGPQGAHSQRLLNEIAAARLVLLDPAKKRAYDEALRARLAPPAPPAVVAVRVPVPPSVAPLRVEVPAAPAMPIASASHAAARRPQKDVTIEILKIVGGGLAGIVISTLLLRFGFGIDVTGLLPVETPPPPANVVKKPKPIENGTSTNVHVAPPGQTNPTKVEPPPEEMEEYVEPTPSGPVKKKKKKGKNKPSPPVVASPIPEAVGPTVTDPPPSEPGTAPPKSPADFKVKSATLLPRRLPAPAEAERLAAQQRLDSTFDLTKLKEDAEKKTKAVELLGLGLDRQAPPAERWTVLRKAADLAADAGEARIVSQAMDGLAQAFEPDVLTEEAELLVKAARGARTAEQMQALVETSRATIQAALATHQYVLARDLASAVRNASDRPAGQPYRKFIFDGQREIVRQQEAWYVLRDARAKLESQPNDADANLAGANWWILERGDWESALPYLARAGKPLLKTAAELEQARGQDGLAIASAWYDAGMAEPVTPLWLVRAKDWYAAIDKTQISGLDGALVDRRLTELTKSGEPQPALAQIAIGRGAARLHSSLAPVVRRHCMLAMPLEQSDKFHNGKSYMFCDRSGQANHGALHGVKPAAGQAGMALEFSGPEDFVECPDKPSLNPVRAMTICAWVKQHSVVQPGGIDDLVSKEEWGGGTGRGFSVRFYQGRPDVNFGNGPDWLSTTAPQALEQGTWVHVAGVYDGQKLVLLINGTEVAAAPTNKTISTSPQPLRIGRGPFAQDRRFHGIIDEVAIFDMALTAADLQAIIDLG